MSRLEIPLGYKPGSKSNKIKSAALKTTGSTEALCRLAMQVAAWVDFHLGSKGLRPTPPQLLQKMPLRVRKPMQTTGGQGSRCAVGGCQGRGVNKKWYTTHPAPMEMPTEEPCTGGGYFHSHRAGSMEFHLHFNEHASLDILKQ